MKKPFINQTSLYLKFAFIRVLLAICIRSYAQPDEFWQGPEVAHREVYGYGYLTWEWTYNEPLRSPMYHSLFSLFYFILQKIGIENDFLIAYGPRIIQSFLSAIMDIYAMKFMSQEGVNNHLYMILVMFTSWFPLYIMSRTLVNNFETLLFTISLYYWRKYIIYGQNKDQIICRIFVCMNFAARGTSIVPWIVIWPLYLLTSSVEGRSFIKQKFYVLSINIITIIFMVSLSVAIDSLYHQKLTWCIWNFTKFNLLEGKSAFYGEHNFIWLFGTIIYEFLGWSIFMPFGVYHIFKQDKLKQKNHELLITVFFFLCVLGLSPHKEDRFLLPMLPIFYLWICTGLEYCDKYLEKQQTIDHVQNFQNLLRFRKLIIIFAVLSNLVLFSTQSVFKDVGALSTMEKLRGQPNLNSVQFFLQCHSHPYYAYLHRNIPMRFPDCSPFTPKNESENWRMYEDSDKFVDEALSKFDLPPSHIVIYEFLYNKLEDKFNKLGYKVVEKTFHALSTETSVGYIVNVYILILTNI